LASNLITTKSSLKQRKHWDDNHTALANVGGSL
jgi:hypothetical protein